MVRIQGPKDFWSGLLFMSFGGLGLAVGSGYAFGSALDMGPGFFPVVLSGGLLLLGAAIAWRGVSIEGEAIEASAFRPQAAILASIVVAALTINRFGLLVAIPATTIVAALGTREFRWREAAGLAVLLTALGIVTFVYLLSQPMPLWGY